MDKNSIIGIILIALILIGYSFLTKPSRERMAEQRRLADSIRIVQEKKLLEAAKHDTLSSLPEQTRDEKQISKSGPAAGNDLGVFSSRATGTEKLYSIENEDLIITLSNRGGRPYSVQLKKYQTYDTLPLILFEGDSTLFGLEFFSDGKSIRTNDLFFETESPEKQQADSNNPAAITFRLPVDSLGAFIEYTYSLKPESYLVDLNLTMSGMNKYRTDNVQLKWEIYSAQLERGRQNEETYTNLMYRFFEGDIEKFKQRSKKPIQDITETTKLEWIAYKQQFFSSVILADKAPFEGGYMLSESFPKGKYLRRFSSELSIPYDRTDNFGMPVKFYFGPNHFQSLKKLGYKLEDLVTVGGSLIRWINAFVVIPIFNWLNKFISNYGIIILLLTIIIKVGLLPLTYKSYMSTAKMRALKPQIDEINEKIPKEKALERQQATMALYKKAGINPMGGCLPMLLQMPILYAMFRFFPASIELRQEKFLWANDLSTYDSILNLPFNIPMYGDHVSLFTLLMTVTTILSMKMTPQASGSDAGMPGMKTMMYMMPVMFMLILNNFSAGLTYYYFLANVLSIGQNYLFKLFIDDEEILRKLNSRKVKTPKKSGFQARLEELAKQRGYKLPK